MWNCLFGGSVLNGGDNFVQLALPKAYGWVILTAVLSTFMLIWKGIQVGRARKKYNVPYPAMYATKGDKQSEEFNCYQRAHQNTLEGYSIFLLLLLIGGLEMPVLSAIAGLVWIAGRISYAKGYYTGDPANRLRGGYAFVGLLTLLLATIKFSLRLACQ